jgi:hypothetical protein
MDPKALIMIVVIIILLYVVIRYAMQDANTLTSLTDGTTMQKVASEDLDGGDSGTTSSNFTYSIWFYLDDWNYHYGKPKTLFTRLSGKGSDASGPPQPCPSVTFAPIQNNIIIALSCVDPTNTSPDGTVHNCMIQNFPVQKWTNFVISVYGRALDVYLDGKLVRTEVLPGLPKINSNAPVLITPKGGFSGWTARFQYWKDASNPQEVWNVYQAGYGASWLSGIFNKYTIKVSLMEGDTETNSVEI